MTDRGIRNNNPGNIERHHMGEWPGMSTDQSSDDRFIVFQTAADGIYALARTLVTYERKYNLDTVQAIIDRWAPTIENCTSAYETAVATGDGVKPTDKLCMLDHPELFVSTVAGIIHQENGEQPYDLHLIRNMCQRAMHL